MKRWHPFLILGLVSWSSLATSGCSDDPTGPGPTDPRLFLTASAGSAHTCGVTVDGSLLCWGWNRDGQLGDGTNVDRSIPNQVVTSNPFREVSAGWSHTCGLTREGVAYCWGSNELGQLGMSSDDHERLHPSAVNTDARFTSISAGGNHTCAVDTEGKAFCWGRNGSGELGGITTEECSHGYSGACSSSPIQVAGGVRWDHVSAGSQHTCGLARNGHVYCWGTNAHGELGTATAELCETSQGQFKECSTSPVPVSGALSWIGLDVGNYHTCALTGDETLYCWGVRGDGALGDGIDTDEWWSFRNEPASVVGGLSFSMVSADARTCAISIEGPTYCWGAYDLGDGTGEDSSAPRPVATSALFSLVTTGGDHTCGMGDEGVLYCWGSNRYGQLGDGSYAVRWPTPVPVKGW